MENTYHIKPNFTMSEISEIELLVAIAIDKEKQLSELDCMDNSIRKSCHKRIAVLYSVLDKINLSNVEVVKGDN